MAGRVEQVAARSVDRRDHVVRLEDAQVGTAADHGFTGRSTASMIFAQSRHR